MIILGVCNANDSGASLIIDGKVVASANEERFVRQKLIRAFPKQSIEYVLRANGLVIDDVDWIGCGAWFGLDIEKTLPVLIEDVYDQIDNGNGLTRQKVYERIAATGKSDTFYRSEMIEQLAEMGAPEEKIFFCDHHLSHALTAFYPSPFEEAIVYCADGRGDFRSVTLWNADRHNGVKLIDFATELTSPGAMYGFVTKIIGFTPNRHEGKVTGLAARGSKTEAYDILKEGFFCEKQSGRIRSRIGNNYTPFTMTEHKPLKKKLSKFSREDISWAAQRLIEEVLIAFLRQHIQDRAEGSINLCLAGGCMSNVKLNYELSQLPQVKNVYVFPAMGDGGNALGGAIEIAARKSNLKWIEMPTVYLGPEYSNEEIQEALEEGGMSYERIESSDKAEVAAKMIAEGVIVGWFQGRMEYGPRALGARSILASAVDNEINDSLNQRLQRSEFMPFAPFTTDKLAASCFIGWVENKIASRFMTICYTCHPIMSERCPAVVHVDNTARPQVVFRDDNPDYYDLVEHYHRMTGNPAIINTSFNHHEEPIVNTPADAVRSFKKGNVDVLVIGDFMVR